MIQQWHHTSAQIALGVVIYVQTADSRRKAVVIAHKPGMVLLQWHA